MSFAKVKGLHGLRHTHMFAICSMYEQSSPQRRF